MAVASAAYSAYNFFSKRSVAAYEMDRESEDAPEDFEAKLRKLARLEEEGVVREQEYEAKRAEILPERWLPDLPFFSEPWRRPIIDGILSASKE